MCETKDRYRDIKPAAEAKRERWEWNLEGGKQRIKNRNWPVSWRGEPQSAWSARWAARCTPRYQTEQWFLVCTDHFLAWILKHNTSFFFLLLNIVSESYNTLYKIRISTRLLIIQISLKILCIHTNTCISLIPPSHFLISFCLPSLCIFETSSWKVMQL